MAFIEKLVGPAENLISIARLHWIYALQGLAWLGGLILLGGALRTLVFIYVPFLLPIGTAFFWIGVALGTFMFLFLYSKMLFTELGLTSERLIYKTGFIFVDVREIDLEEIKSESIDNGTLGRILNYGYLDLDARFIEDIDLPAISAPYKFIKTMNTVRTAMKEDSMRVILQGNENPTSSVQNALDRRSKRREQSYEGDMREMRPHMLQPRGDEDHIQRKESEDAVSDNPLENLTDMEDEFSLLPPGTETNIDQLGEEGSNKDIGTGQIDPENANERASESKQENMEDIEESKEDSSDENQKPQGQDKNDKPETQKKRDRPQDNTEQAPTKDDTKQNASQKSDSDTDDRFHDNQENRKKELSDMVLDDFEEAEDPDHDHHPDKKD